MFLSIRIIIKEAEDIGRKLPMSLVQTENATTNRNRVGARGKGHSMGKGLDELPGEAGRRGSVLV